MSPAVAQAETVPLSGGTSLFLTKLDDNGANWIDYKTKATILMGSKSLMGYVDGTAVPAKCYATNSAGEPVLKDRKTLASDEQIDLREKRVEETEGWEYLARHIILNSV